MATRTPFGRGGVRRALALLAAIGLSGCPATRSCGNEPDSARRAASVTNEASQPAAEKLPLDPFERRAALDAAYRLKPDRRILLAVEAVQRFFVAGSPASATAVQEGERWRIRLGPADVGTLRDLPDFQQALSLVEAFARHLAGEHPATTAAAEASPAPPFDWEPEAIVSLRDAQARWLKAEHSPELVRRACRALASLAFQEVDTLGVGDRLPAQALAMLAITRALGAEATREEALTAAALGYTAAAQAAAMRLPQSDALRLYLEGSSRLESSAAGASLAARYLQLRMLRWADDEEGEERWLRSQLSDEQHRLPVLALRLRSRHGWRSAVAEQMPVDVLLAAAEQAADPRVPLASIANPQVAAAALGFREGRLLTTASELIARVESSAAGPFYDADVVQSYDRAMLYSALAEWSGTLLDGLSSPDAARELSRLLGRDRAPEARDFQQWLLLRIAARQADPSAAGPATKSAPQEGLSGALQKLLFDREQPPRSLRQQLLQALSELPSLGPEAPLLLFEELKSRLDWADRGALAATRALAARLDSRVDHRVQFASLVWDTLHDVALEERLMRSVFRDARSSHPASDLWFARRDGDAGILQELARSAAVPFSLRVDAVSALGKMGRLTPAQLEEQLDRLGGLHPRSRKPTDALVEACTERKEYDKAARAVRRWLANNESRQELDVAIMHATLGRALYKQGRYEEAWQAVEPFLGSWQGGVMRTAAEVAAARGHDDEARDILRKSIDRYPDAIGAARSWWRLRHDDAAAQFLAHLPRRPTVEEWLWSIGKDFAEVFGPLPIEESQKAIAALEKAGLGGWPPSALAEALGHAGFPEHAFEVLWRLANQYRPRPNPAAIVPAYVQLKKWKGDAAALKWIRSGPFLDGVHGIEKTDRGSVAQLIQGLALLVRERHADELVWDLLPDPQPGRFADNFWLQRTIVLLFNPRLATAQRKTALRQHYQGAGSSHYHELGELLLGRLEEQKAAKLATDPEKACEVSYYLGVKAEAEGRLQDATAWYRNAVESAHPGWAEYHWSYAALRRLESSGKTLRRLEAEHAARKG